MSVGVPLLPTAVLPSVPPKHALAPASIDKKIIDTVDQNIKITKEFIDSVQDDSEASTSQSESSSTYSGNRKSNSPSLSVTNEPVSIINRSFNLEVENNTDGKSTNTTTTTTTTADDINTLTKITGASRAHCTYVLEDHNWTLARAQNAILKTKSEGSCIQNIYIRIHVKNSSTIRLLCPKGSTVWDIYVKVFNELKLSPNSSNSYQLIYNDVVWTEDVYDIPLESLSLSMEKAENVFLQYDG